METPRDPQDNPDSGSGLEAFEAALADARAAVNEASQRAEAVLGAAPGASEPSPEAEYTHSPLEQVLTSRGDIGEEGGVGSPLMGDLITERFQEGRPETDLPAEADPPAAPPGTPP